jgi:hypothetical protein
LCGEALLVARRRTQLLERTLRYVGELRDARPETKVVRAKV